MASLHAVFLLGTLKRRGQFSNTETLSEVLVDSLKSHDVASEIIHLVEYDIKPGTRSDMGKGDDWPGILKKIAKAEILIFATPIWWGIHSSVMQRAIERMDELNDDLLATGDSKLHNKVAGIVITGAEDGAEHIIGNICNFCTWNGMTLPPACSLSWLGDASTHSKASLKRKFSRGPTRKEAVMVARNLAFFARLLKANPIPTDKSGEEQSLT
jgi:multimeric flavodoxin WrbA